MDKVLIPRSNGPSEVRPLHRDEQNVVSSPLSSVAGSPEQSNRTEQQQLDLRSPTTVVRLGSTTSASFVAKRSKDDSSGLDALCSAARRAEEIDQQLIIGNKLLLFQARPFHGVLGSFDQLKQQLQLGWGIHTKNDARSLIIESICPLRCPSAELLASDVIVSINDRLINKENISNILSEISSQTILKIQCQRHVLGHAYFDSTGMLGFRISESNMISEFRIGARVSNIQRYDIILHQGSATDKIKRHRLNERVDLSLVRIVDVTLKKHQGTNSY